MNEISLDEAIQILEKEKSMRIRVFRNKPQELAQKVDEIQKILNLLKNLKNEK